MAQATLAVTIPEDVWIQQVSTMYPTTTFRVLAAVPGPTTGFALVRILGEAIDDVVAEMDDHPQLTELTLVRRTDGEATVHFETTAPLLLVSARESGLPIELPIEIRDGETTIEVTGSRDRLAALADQLERFGMQYRIEQISERLHESQLLSDRQLEVVATAVEKGYYDTPRRCSLTDLATDLGIAKSTCSETLHRAEGAIIKRFVTDAPSVSDGTIEDGNAE